MIRFLLNDQSIETTLPGGKTLLDFIRYDQQLRGTKIGCREGDCGACTILVGTLKEGKLTYQSATSCLMPLRNAHHRHIITIEGLNMDQLSPVQQAIVEEGGTQCGFCTIGFVLSLSGYCLQQKPSTTSDAIASMDGNICRCTGYKPLERAAQKINSGLQQKDSQQPIDWLIQHQYIPAYFADIPKKLARLISQTSDQAITEAAPLVGGGTDVYVQRPEELEQGAVRSSAMLSDKKVIWMEGNRTYISGTSTVSDLLASPIMQAQFPDLAAHIKLVSSTPIRNMATLAGNLVNASPIGDLTIFFLALDSQLHLRKGHDQRVVALSKFYKAYKKIDLQKDEWVAALSFESRQKTAFFNFEKVSKRTHLDIASVNSACHIQMDGSQILAIQISAGGIGPTPQLLPKTAEFLKGKYISAAMVHQAASILSTEISPISDARGSANYKSLLLRQLLWAHLLRCFPGALQLVDLRTATA